MDPAAPYPAGAASAAVDLEPIKALLEQWSLQQWLSTKPPTTVITLSTSMSTGQALKMLAVNNIQVRLRVCE